MCILCTTKAQFRFFRFLFYHENAANIHSIRRWKNHFFICAFHLSKYTYFFRVRMVLFIFFISHLKMFDSAMCGINTFDCQKAHAMYFHLSLTFSSTFFISFHLSCMLSVYIYRGCFSFVFFVTMKMLSFIIRFQNKKVNTRPIFSLLFIHQNTKKIAHVSSSCYIVVI